MPTNVQNELVGGEVQIEEVAPKWRAVRGLGGGAVADSRDLNGACLVMREFGLEYLGVGVRLHTEGGVGRVGRPCLTTHSDVGCRTQRVFKGGGPAVNTRNGEGVVCANNVVRALVTVGGQVAKYQVVAGRPLVLHDAAAVETVTGRCGSLPIWTSLGVRSVVTLTELSNSNST